MNTHGEKAMSESINTYAETVMSESINTYAETVMSESINACDETMTGETPPTRAAQLVAGGRPGRERAARHERSSERGRGAAGSPDPALVHAGANLRCARRCTARL
jgi:hypothetical protein